MSRDEYCFDRVAAVYDATRGLPPRVRDAAVGQLAAAAERAETRTLLDLGVGTGRVAVPLAERGFTVAGVDLSPAMLTRLRARLAPGISGRLWTAVADARRLPFRDDTFRACLATHIFHLIPDLDAALDEVERVLVPGGLLLYVGDTAAAVTGGSRLRREWRRLLAEEGFPLRHRRRLLPRLKRRGWQARPAPRLEWSTALPVRDALTQIRERNFSGSWQAPEEVHRRVCDRLERWAAETLGLEASERVRRRWRLYELRVGG